MYPSDAKAIEEFLAKIGHDSYKEMFVENDMDLEMLKEMNSKGNLREVLKDIGIASFGHQHEIIEGVKQLG